MYAAPEIFISKPKYGLKVDIWSLGILAYELKNGSCKPQCEVNYNNVLSEEAYEIPWVLNDSNTYQNFVNRCLKEDPKMRPTIDELLTDVLFDKLLENVE